MRRGFIVLLVLAMAIVGRSGAHAQEAATVTGAVTDETGQPLVSATVLIHAMDLGTLTDE